MRKIPLTKGMCAIVDDEDYERIASRKWMVWIDGKTGLPYAYRETYRRKTIDRKPGRSIVWMHREVLQVSGEVDHRETSDTLDNRRSNLRECTRSQNNANRRLFKNSSSGLKGAYYRGKGENPWYSAICVNKVNHYLGSFPSKNLAHDAFCVAASFYFGEFARVA